MLILAGISLSGLIGGKGLFQRTKDASNIYNEKKAREVLETVLLSDGQFEKNINPKYNEEEFLNKLIKDEIPGSNIRGDVAIIGGEYAYDLDRSVPKIGIRGNNGYLGNPKDLVWPDLDVTVTLADDKKDATIKIEASEKKNGINKIEIWLLGEKIKEYTYEPSKPEVTENYIATQNGKYTIKAYGELMDSKTVEVDGIVASVKFEPNGNTIWEKEHSTKIKVKETEEKIKSMKYVWTNSVIEPEDNAFTENCKDGDTITKNEVTGKYYLWILLETEGGAKAKRRSEAFYFDNQGPNIIAFTATKYSGTGITLSATAQDTESGTVRFVFSIVEGTKEITKEVTCTATTESVIQSVTITGLTIGSHDCKVVVYDDKNNNSNTTTLGTTKLYTWARSKYTPAKWNLVQYASCSHWNAGYTANKASEYDVYMSYSIDEITGEITLSNYSKIGSYSLKDKFMKCTGCGRILQLSHTYTSGSGNYLYYGVSSVKSEKVSEATKGPEELIYSSNPSAYPINVVNGGYYYAYKGIT